MDKLYYIVCEEHDTTLFEGRYQGRTRGGALKFLKEKLNRRTLSGLVFTITEIPVPLIRDIVAAILAGRDPAACPVTPFDSTPSGPVPGVTPATRFDAFAETVPAGGDGEPAEQDTPTQAAEPTPRSSAKVGNPGLGDEFWSGVRAHWQESRNMRATAEHFGLSPNSVKTRARREGWNA